MIQDRIYYNELFKLFLLLGPVFVSLFWAGVLNIPEKSRKVPKLFLGRFMIVAFILYVSHLFYFLKIYPVYYYLDAIYVLASLLVYPLYHIYVRLLTIEKWFSLRLHWKFLIAPFVVFILELIGITILGPEGANDYYNGLLNNENPAPTVYQYLKIIYSIFRFVFIFQVIYYLIMSFRLIRQHNNQLKNYYSNTEKHSLFWVQFFNVSMGLASISSIVLAYLGKEVFLEKQFLLIFPSLMFTLLLFFIGFLGNRQSESAIEHKEERILIRSNKDIEPVEAVDVQDAWKYKALLDDLFEREKIYKDSDLKIWDLAGMMGTNRTYVSRIINKEYGRNFCNHVNYYRVVEVKKLIAEGKNLSNEQLAELSGFGSVNSLYRAFLAIEKIPLGQYRKA